MLNTKGHLLVPRSHPCVKSYWEKHDNAVDQNIKHTVDIEVEHRIYVDIDIDVLEHIENNILHPLQY